MRRVLLVLGLLCAIQTSATGAILARGAPPTRGSGPTPVPGRVLVVDDGGRIDRGPRGELSARPSSLAGLLARHGLSRCAALWRGAAPGRTRCYALESSRSDFDPVLAARELRATGLVRAAVPDLRLRLHVVPNDPDLPIQWYVDDGGVADVSLPAAWNVEKGSPTVRIGVMDTGVDLGHPDLASKIWTNPGEIEGNALDDDGNGYVDDVHGWDFGDGDDDPNPHAVPDPDAFDVDVGFHGTFVAGIAAAAPDNGEGIAGAAWNCRVVPLKVVNSAGEITLEAMTEAFAYATAKHIEVLNISLGTPDEPGVAEYFQALVDAATAAGVLVVASAGNSGTADLNYPAACEGVLSVAATDETNARASFSSFGPTVRIAAPGSGMWSAICRNYTIDDFSQLFYEVFFYWDPERPYMLGDGTSFSAPLVAGASALVRSRHPGWAPLTVASHMVGTGDIVAYDEAIGPRLNAYRALTEDAVSVPVAPASAYALDVTPNPSTANARIRFTLPVGGETRLRVYDCAGRLVRELASGDEAAGEHVLLWDGADSHGRQPSAGIYVMRLDTPAGTMRRKFVRAR